MKKFLLKTATFAAIASVAIVPLVAYGQNASSTTSTKPKANTEAKMSKARERGNAEVDQRVESLNKLVTRIGDMKKISDADKASLVSTLQNLISDLTTLKTKINADTTATDLKTDVQSITNDYRVYALVLPRTQIFAAADRILTLDDQMTTLSGKIAARLNAAVGVSNVADLQKTLTDLNAKIIDSGTQAHNAVAQISTLVPDGGDKTKMTANTTALKSARDMIKKAETDLKTARKDAETIVKALGKDKSNGGKGDKDGDKDNSNGTSTATSTHN